MPYSYGLKYQSTVYNKGLGWCHINILKKNYGGTVTTLQIQFNGVNINLNTTDYFDPIKSTNVEINIVNDLSDFYELDDLFSVSDLEYYIKIYNDNSMLFRGFIPCGVVEQQWLKSGVINLIATCDLNRLGNFTPSLLSTVGTYTLFNIIYNCLSYTGMDLPIMINSTLREGSGFATGHTCFDDAWVDSDLFQKDNINLEDCKTILSDILSAFDCIIYYYNDCWYIERFKDIGTVNKTYCVYVNGSYTGISAVDSNTHLTIPTDLQWMNETQRIRYTSGLKEIDLTITEKRRYNYLNPYYNTITAAMHLNVVEFQGMSYYHWGTIDESYVGWLSEQYQHNMNNLILINNIYDSHSFDIINSSVGGYSDLSFRRSIIGVYSTVYLKLNSNENSSGAMKSTSFTISFKFKLPQNFIDEFSSDPPGTDFVHDCFVNPAKYKFYARFFIGIPGRYWLVYNNVTNLYEFRQQNDITKYGGQYNFGLITEEIPFSSFTNKKNFYHEFSKTVEVPVDINTTSNIFYVGICELGYNNPLYSGISMSQSNIALRSSIYGDIVFTANDTLEDNQVVGSISSDFLDTKQETMNLCDVSNYSVLNAMFTDNVNKYHTIDWIDNTYPVRHLTLAKHFIEDRFQVYNKVRKEITSDIYSEKFLKPFALIDLPTSLLLSGLVHTYNSANLDQIVGVGTHFTTSFVVGDYILVVGQPIRKILSIYDNTLLFVTEEYPVNFLNGSYYKGKTFYVNGYKFNLDSMSFNSASLKEYVSDDNIT